jgi:hypothetical protein
MAPARLNPPVPTSCWQEYGLAATGNRALFPGYLFWQSAESGREREKEPPSLWANLDKVTSPRCNTSHNCLHNEASLEVLEESHRQTQHLCCHRQDAGRPRLCE